MWTLCVYFCILLVQRGTCQWARSEISRSVAGEGEDSFASSRSSSPIETHNRLTLVCTEARREFRNHISNPAISSVYSESGLDPESFHDKISPNHQGSVCQNLNLTCCTPKIEKSSESLARDEYKLYYDEIFKVHAETCTSPGKIFHQSALRIIRSLVQTLEDRLNLALGEALPPGTLKGLSDYLVSSSMVPDICPLPDLLDELTQTLVELVVNSTLAEDEEYDIILRDSNATKCAVNVSISLIEHHQTRMMQAMLKHLEDLRLFSQSLSLSHEVMDTIRHYSMSQSCAIAITRMKHCSICGGYGNFKPCLFKCINTMRGCFADLAEIHGDFSGLLTSLRTLSVELIAEMAPETFDRSYLNNFVLMVQELGTQKENIKEIVQAECNFTMETNGNDSSNTLTRKKRAGSLIQPIQGSKSRPKKDPLLEQLDRNFLDTVVEVEIGCLERVAGKMLSASEDICTNTRFNIAHKSNSQCWNGAIFGRYDHLKAGFMKTDQLSNPEFMDLVMSLELRYGSLIGKLHNMTKKINATIAFNTVCQDSDDEDCYRNTNGMFTHCVTRNTVPDLEISGSGSGSGSGMDYGEGETMLGSDTYDSVWVSTTERKVTPSRKPDISTSPPTVPVTDEDNRGERPADHGIDNHIPAFTEKEVVHSTPSTTKEDREPSPATVTTVRETTTTTTTTATSEETTDGDRITTGGVATGGVTGTGEGGTTSTDGKTPPPPVSDLLEEEESENSALFHTATFFTTCTALVITLSNALPSF